MTKYFVISLPRTGTSSLCRMAKICGFSPVHAPHVSFNRRLADNETNFFSDTPVYCPKIIEQICIDQHIDSKFIYVDRNPQDIINSWKRVGLYNNYRNMLNTPIETLSPSVRYDLESYTAAFNDHQMDEHNFIDICNTHKNCVINKVKQYNKKVLIYTFEQEWAPFCEFIGAAIPNEHIPVLNKNKMFDKI